MRNPVDTVEEFWTFDLISQMQSVATENSIDSFKRDFGTFLGVSKERVHFMPSGHQGLEVLLRSKCNQGNIVMLPAFNCQVVQDAVIAAGLKSTFYDFSSQPGVFNWELVMSQMNSDVGVIVVTHYFGVPIDFEPILDHCRRKDILVIEDCAHTLGGALNGSQVGTIGDASIYSFNYDKPISLGWGGVAVINNEDGFNDLKTDIFRVPKLTEEYNLLNEFNDYLHKRRRMIPNENKFVTKLLKKFRLLSPNLFRKNKDISIGAIQAELGRWCILKYPKVLRQRNSNAKKLADLLNFQTWEIGINIKAAWVKQKVCIPDEKLRGYVSQLLQMSGIRAGNFNWPELLQGADKDSFPLSAELSNTWIDVPIHQNINSEILNEIITTLSKNNQKNSQI